MTNGKKLFPSALIVAVINEQGAIINPVGSLVNEFDLRE